MNLELTKQKFLEMSETGSLFDVEPHSLEWLFDVEPYSNELVRNLLLDNYNDGKKKSQQVENWKIGIENEFYAVRKSGEMFTYGNPIVPISFYTIINKDGSKSVRYIGKTIDDSSQSFWISENTDTKEGIEKIYKDIFEFLYNNKEMLSELDFQEYWEDKGVHDFYFN